MAARNGGVDADADDDAWADVLDASYDSGGDAVDAADAADAADAVEAALAAEAAAEAAAAAASADTVEDPGNRAVRPTDAPKHVTVHLGP